jgi:hypothetical protein
MQDGRYRLSTLLLSPTSLLFEQWNNLLRDDLHYVDGIKNRLNSFYPTKIMVNYYLLLG